MFHACTFYYNHTGSFGFEDGYHERVSTQQSGSSTLGYLFAFIFAGPMANRSSESKQKEQFWASTCLYRECFCTAGCIALLQFPCEECQHACFLAKISNYKT